MTIREFKQMLIDNNISDDVELYIPLNSYYGDIDIIVNLAKYEPTNNAIILTNKHEEKPIIKGKK